MRPKAPRAQLLTNIWGGRQSCWAIPVASGEGRPRGAELTEISQGALIPGPEPWQENGLQAQLWPQGCPGWWVQMPFSPQPGTGLRQREPSCRGKLRLFRQMNKGCLEDGGHEPGMEGSRSFRAIG